MEWEREGLCAGIFLLEEAKSAEVRDEELEVVSLCPKESPCTDGAGACMCLWFVSFLGEHGRLVQQLGELLLDGFATYVAGDDGTVLCYEYGSGD